MASVLTSRTALAYPRAMRSLQSSFPLWMVISLAAACDNTSSPPSSSDVPAADAVVADVGTPDAGTPDAGTPDAGTPDAGTPDAGTPDVGTPDVGTPDVGTPDSGTTDSGTPDVGTADAGTPDAGTPDVGTPDAGTPDAGASVPDAAALCAMLPANTAPVISDTYSTTPMPVMSSLTGGTILPGTYFQTAHIYHGVASGPVHTWQTTSVFDSSGTAFSLNGNRDGAVFQQLVERISISGAALTVTVACPSALAGMTITVGYNYVANELHLFTYSDNTETVFRRQ